MVKGKVKTEKENFGNKDNPEQDIQESEKIILWMLEGSFERILSSPEQEIQGSEKITLWILEPSIPKNSLPLVILGSPKIQFTFTSTII